AYELAKDAKGATKSLTQVINESATDLVETAPHKIGQVSHQAQQAAVALEQHIEAARDTVSEIAEAFRSGWEEYGEEIVSQSADGQPHDNQSVDNPPAQAVPDILHSHIEDEAESEESVAV